MANITHSKWTAWLSGMWSICFSLHVAELSSGILCLEITHTGIPPRLLIVRFLPSSFMSYFLLSQDVNGASWRILVELSHKGYSLDRRKYNSGTWFEKELVGSVTSHSWCCAVGWVVLLWNSAWGWHRVLPPWWKKVIIFHVFDMNGMLYTSR